MNTNDALTTTATQVETILTHHSVTYTTTDNRGKEEDGDYRVTVGDVTAYLTASDDGAAEIPTAVSVIAVVAEETTGDYTATYWDGYWEVEDSHTTVEVDTAGDWTVTQSDVDGIEWSGYEGRDVAAVFRAGALAYGQPLDAITTVIMGGDYEMADWWSIVDGLTELQATDGDAGTRVYNHWGSGHPGVLVTEEHDDTESRWIITDLDTVTTSVEHGAQDAAAVVIYTLA